ncbi:MAG: hypothetical protein ACI30R_09310 [Sodaliphilus sp.]
MAYFVGIGVDKHGWDKFFSGEVDYGSDEITKFVSQIKDIITDGKISHIQSESRGETLSDDERYGQRVVQRGGRATDRGNQDDRGGAVGDDADLLFRDDDNFTVRDRAIARDAYERMVSTGRYQFQEAVQDSMLGLKKLYQAVLGKSTRIENIPTNENAYIAENLMSSVNAAEQLLRGKNFRLLIRWRMAV